MWKVAMDKKIMHTNAGKSENFARYITDGARINQEHVGRRLLESLSKPVADRIRGTDFNPMHMDDMSYEDVVNWLDDHIVFDYKGDQIGLFDGTEWIWEADKNG